MSRNRPKPQLPPSSHEASGQLEELAQVLSALPEWQSVKDAMIETWSRTGDQDKTIEAGRSALRQGGLGGEAILAHIPEQYAPLLGTEDRVKVIGALDLLMVASAANEIMTGSPLPLPSLAGGGVTVETVEQDGMSFSVVHAYVTALGDPEDIAAQFVVASHRTFDSETFARREQGARDAEWWRRKRLGESYREIAMSDDRSGLPPEARADEVTYRPDITRATDNVRRAVRRFERRWTQKLDSLSKSET